MSGESGGGFGDALVVDASVVAKWYLEEEAHQRAARILEAGRSGDTRLIAPVIALAEFGNVLWQRNRREELTRDEIGEVWKAFSAAPITLVGITSLMPPAQDIALDSGCAVYDALYLALAEAREAKLVTADGKLVRTLEGSSFANSVVAL